VQIVNQPVKLGWTADGSLYIEAHPALAESNVDGENVVVADTDTGEAFQESPLTGLMRAYIAATGERGVDLNWEVAERVALFGRGIPEPVSIQSGVTQVLTESFAAEPVPSGSGD
jgi:hypothetical protein